MIDRTKQRLHRSQPKSPEGDNNDKDDRDDDWGSSGGDQGRSKAEEGVVAAVILNGGGRKRGRFQGGAGRQDPGVHELDTIEYFAPTS